MPRVRLDPHLAQGQLGTELDPKSDLPPDPVTNARAHGNTSCDGEVAAGINLSARRTYPFVRPLLPLRLHFDEEDTNTSADQGEEQDNQSGAQVDSTGTTLD